MASIYLRTAVVAILLAITGAVKVRVDGNKLVDQHGRRLKLHGISWFGFNNAQTMVDGLWAGETSLTKDMSTQIYRMQLLGFNAIRLPFSFKDLVLPEGRGDYSWCRQATSDEIRRSVTPPWEHPYARPLPSPKAPLLAGGGRCNIGMPDSVFDRLVWMVQYCAKAGMVVVLDNHVHPEDPTAVENPKSWVRLWAKLATEIAKDEITRGAVMYDLINEPDNRKLFWLSRAGRPSLAKLYLDAMDAITEVQPDAIFVLEGTGQNGYGVHPGDGFVTDAEIIKSYAGKKSCTNRYCLTGIEDPSFFFNDLLAKPYASQVVIGPHFALPSILPYAIPKELNEAPGLFKRMSDSFGYLSSQGYCNPDNKCIKFPVLLGEFSAPTDSPKDQAAAKALVQYIKNEDDAEDGRHERIDNWFFWCFNQNSPDTNGGIVKENWEDIDWDKIQFLQQIGLKPWFEG